MDHTVKILNKEYLTHDVIRLTLEKPDGFEYTAGQAVEMSLPDAGLEGKRSPFTLTSLNHQPRLEFIIKIYSDRKGMTLAISAKEAGDQIFISDPWDSFKNNGPGVFIAGGTGITPFIAILRQLKADGNLEKSQLFFSNKTREDIFLQHELNTLLGEKYINVLTREINPTSAFRLIDENFLKSHVTHFSQPFYVCGPPGFVEKMHQYLIRLGAVKELVDLSL